MAIEKAESPEKAAEKDKAVITMKKTKTVSKDADKTANTERDLTAGTVTLAYIGPSLPAGQLKTNRILVGTISEIKQELGQVLERYPLVEKLLVPVGKMAEKKDKTRTAGNILNKYYTDLVSSIAGQASAGEE